jgi:hypothetical protein
MTPRLGIPAALLTATVTLALAACGGDDAPESASRAAPAASEFPSPDGRTLLQVLNEADAEGPVISPSGQIYPEGEYRYAFGVFDVGGEQITDADVALYAAPGRNGEAQGPFPAAVEDLSVEGPFLSRTTAQDPDSAKAVYVTSIDFDRSGEWRIGALIHSGDTLQASLAPSAVVDPHPDVPQVGDEAPLTHTPTADDVTDISQIDTRDPPDTMHEDDLADVLGKEPVVLLFASPALCRSRTCSPVVDAAEQVKADYGDQAAFIHVEPYQDNSIDKGASAPAQAYGLETEPWLFVIDRDGVIRTAIEGAFSAGELETAVQEVTG